MVRVLCCTENSRRWQRVFKLKAVALLLVVTKTWEVEAKLQKAPCCNVIVSRPEKDIFTLVKLWKNTFYAVRHQANISRAAPERFVHLYYWDLAPPSYL